MKIIIITMTFLATLLGYALTVDINSDLLEVCRKGQIEQVKTLLSQGADINTQDRLGRTALIRASIAGRLDIVDLLLTQGAYAGAQDFSERSAVDYARFFSYSDIIERVQSAPAANWEMYKSFAQDDFTFNWNVQYGGSGKEKRSWEAKIFNQTDTWQTYDLIISGCINSNAGDSMGWISRDGNWTILDKRENIRIPPGGNRILKGSFIVKGNGSQSYLPQVRTDLIPKGN